MTTYQVIAAALQHQLLSRSVSMWKFGNLSDLSEEEKTSNSYSMGCPPVHGDNPRALASGLSYVQVDKHGIIILYHLHQCRPCTS